MHHVEFNRELVEKLAEAAHEIFCDDLRAKGYKYGLLTQKSKKMHSSLMPYHELPENEKEQNRNYVRDIPSKLASIGYSLLAARDDKSLNEFSADEIELLAKMEHKRWMQEKLNADWRYSEKTNKSRRLHKDLLPWHDLSDNEKEKDRVLVRNIPRILAEAGYTMVRLD